MIKANYHTHSLFCDGKESAEAMAQEAVRRGFSILGFSSHAMFPFSNDWHIGARDFGSYCGEIGRLKEAYRGRLEILMGFEADFIPGLCRPDMEAYRQFAPDFIIGSVHYVMGDGGYFEADGPQEETRKRIGRYFGGNVREAVHRYFESERQMLAESEFTVIGHADLIRKQNGRGGPHARPLFSEEEDWYKEELVRTADSIKAANVIVEINTGGMARGYLDSPYPSPAFLRLLHEREVPVMINSDAHRTGDLDFAFDQAVRLARETGYTRLAYLDGRGIQFQAISNG